MPKRKDNYKDYQETVMPEEVNQTEAPEEFGQSGQFVLLHQALESSRAFRNLTENDDTTVPEEREAVLVTK